MDSVRKSFRISINNVRKWGANPRIYILAILLFIFVWTFIRPILDFSRSVNYKVTPWLFPYLTNYYFSQMLIMIGIVFLFCDAPFMDSGQPYLILRSGRMTWGLGQVLYIMVGTAIYLLFVTIVSIMILAPNLFFSNSWGKVLGTLAQTDAARQFKISIPISYAIQAQYTAVQAFFLSFLLEWCACVMLGLIIYITNAYFKRTFGAIVGVSFVLFDTVISNAGIGLFPYYFSPVSMARLTVLDPSGISTHPTNLYAYIFYTIGILLLSIIAILSMQKRDIQVLPPI
jgi:hypothetical protein